MSFEDYLKNVGINFGQAALVAGGLFTAFFVPMIFPVGKGSGPEFFHLLGGAMVAAGGAWFLVDKSKAVTTAAVSYPMYDAPMKGANYPKPINNMSDVKPRNRFDRQTNFILNDGNSSFDNYINDIIINESKQAGFNLLDKNNYPVTTAPYLIPALNPTTPTTPSRDFNTVKMIA
jgi:hypothetical protein